MPLLCGASGSTFSSGVDEDALLLNDFPLLGADGADVEALLGEVATSLGLELECNFLAANGKPCGTGVASECPSFMALLGEARADNVSACTALDALRELRNGDIPFGDER